MKRACSIVAILVLLLTLSLTAVATGGDLNADEQRLVNYLSKVEAINGERYLFKSADVAAVKNYFKTIDATAAQIDHSIAALQVALDAYKADPNVGVLDMSKLEYRTRRILLDQANVALEPYNAYAIYNSSTNSLEIYQQDGTLIYESVVTIIKQTGEDYTVAIILSGVIILSLIGAGLFFIHKKKLSF